MMCLVMEQATGVDTETATRSPLDVLSGYFTEHATALEGLKAEVAVITAERDEVIKTAARPFEESLGRLNQKIREHQTSITTDQLERLFREQVKTGGPLYRASFELLLELYGVDIPKFLEAHAHGNYPSSTVTEQLDGIVALEQSVQKNPSESVFTFSLQWFEDVDSQAEWESRPSATGYWLKKLKGSFGYAPTITVNNEQLFVPTSLEPLMKPVAVTLELFDATDIESCYDWGSLKAEVEASPHKVFPLLQSPAWETPHPIAHTVAWKASQAYDFSLHRPRLRGGVHRMEDPQIYLFYGQDSVRQAIENLTHDQDIPDDMKRELTNLQRQL